MDRPPRHLHAVPDPAPTPAWVAEEPNRVMMGIVALGGLGVLFGIPLAIVVAVIVLT